MLALGPQLLGLRDVDGVIGSLLFDLGGRVLARDLPRVFEDTAAEELGSRVARLVEAFAASGSSVSTVSLRFAEHRLYLRREGALQLCVVTAEVVNQPALRMASNVLIRRLGAIPPEDLQGLAEERPGAAAPPPEPTPQQAPPRRAAAAPRPRFYRGQRID